MWHEFSTILLKRLTVYFFPLLNTWKVMKFFSFSFFSQLLNLLFVHPRRTQRPPRANIFFCLGIPFNLYLVVHIKAIIVCQPSKSNDSLWSKAVNGNLSSSEGIAQNRKTFHMAIFLSELQTRQDYHFPMQTIASSTE